MRRALFLLAAAALAVVVVIGLTQAGGSSDTGASGHFDLAKAKRQLQGAPGPLAALHDQSNEILEGGTSAFDGRLAALKGHPVVINKWASWCGPCRSEFPVFQQVGSSLGKRVAFIGLDSGDAVDDARQ